MRKVTQYRPPFCRPPNKKLCYKMVKHNNDTFVRKVVYLDRNNDLQIRDAQVIFFSNPMFNKAKEEFNRNIL